MPAVPHLGLEDMHVSGALYFHQWAMMAHVEVGEKKLETWMGDEFEGKK